jgi:hypothetical protein
VSYLDPFSSYINGKYERQKMQFQAMNSQEVAHIGGRYALERESTRRSTALEVERMKQSGQYGLQEREHFYKSGLLDREYDLKSSMQIKELENRLEIERERGILTRWIEKFRGDNSFKMESMRQSGVTKLQESELTHQVGMMEIEQAEQNYRMDKAHAHELEVTGKFAELEKFKIHCGHIYALEEKRFEIMLNERKGLHEQLLKEFDAQNMLGANANTNISDMTKQNLSSNNSMNQSILDMFLRVQEAKARAKIETSDSGEEDRLAREWHER